MKEDIYEVERDREPTLRDRVAQLEKAMAGAHELLDEVRALAKRLAREVGVD